MAYIPKPKFARVVRQTVLNKLAGHHLALAGLGGEGGEGAEGEAEALAPGVMAADGALRRAAFATALAQASAGVACAERGGGGAGVAEEKDTPALCHKPAVR